MKRLLNMFRVAVFVIALSISISAGHILGGGYGSCSCGEQGCLPDYPGECGDTNAMSPDYSLLAVILVAALFGFRLKR